MHPQSPLRPNNHPEMDSYLPPFFPYSIPYVVYVNMMDTLLGDHQSVIDISTPSTKH